MNKIYAHRGLCREYPENSLEAIKAASLCDFIYGIEFDVRMTKDNNFVVTHDKDITLKSNGTGLISEMTLEELYKYDFSYNHVNIKKEYVKSFFKKDGIFFRKQIKNLKNKKFKICTLDDILKNIKNKKLLIEIKSEKNTKFDIEKFYNIIKKYDNKNIMIQSFNINIINKLRKKDENLNLGILIGSYDINKKLKMNVNFISVEHSIIDKEKALKQLKLNKEINLWTVNDYKEIKKLKKVLGNLFEKVNIITDTPYIIQKYLK